MKIYAVRHPETVWNRVGRVQGWRDSPLTARGKAMVLRLGQRLTKLDVVEIRSSDLGRCVTTARIIAKACGARVLRTTQRLREQNFGALDGKRDDCDAIRTLTADTCPPGGQSNSAMARRIQAYIRCVAKRPRRHGNILLVTHDGPMRAVYGPIAETDIVQLAVDARGRVRGRKLKT